MSRREPPGEWTRRDSSVLDALILQYRGEELNYRQRKLLGLVTSTHTPHSGSCIRCRRATRPKGTTITERPGTVVVGGRGYCGTCITTASLQGYPEWTAQQKEMST